MLNSALYVPSYQQSIFSVHAAVERGGGGASVSLGKGVKQLQRNSNSISSSKNIAFSLNEWHKIMGRCNYGDLRKLGCVVQGMRVTNYEDIECMLCNGG